MKFTSSKTLNSCKILIKKILRYFNARISKVFKMRIINWLNRPFISKFNKDQTGAIFEAIYFELRTRCNSSCEFCAASVQNDTRSDISMPMDKYKSIIDQLGRINYSGMIAFHVNSEPLLVQNLEDYVVLARHSCPKAHLQILSNGKKLTKDRALSLIRAGINELTINDYKLDISLPNHPKFLEIERYLEENGYKIFRGQERNKFDLNSKEIQYNVFSRLLSEQLNSRGGTSPNIIARSSEVGSCQYPFQQLNITANGNVSQCCSDVNFEKPMGNAFIETLEEIWLGPKFSSVRGSLERGLRCNEKLCRECDFVGGDSYTGLRKFVAKLMSV